MKSINYSVAAFAVLFALANAVPVVYTPQATSDRITSLPNGFKPKFGYFGGYIPLDQGKNTYYQLAEAKTNPAAKPLVFYFSGGPGCSSLGLGSFSLNGPFTFWNTSIIANPNAWNRVANIAYVDNPVGAGFSYATDQSAVVLGDDAVAADIVTFIRGFFDRFPQYKGRDMYLAGESFAGHYIPITSSLLKNGNNDDIAANFKGFIIGNPYSDLSTEFLYGTEYQYQQGMISRQTRDDILKYCANLNVGQLSLETEIPAPSRRLLVDQALCTAAREKITTESGGIDLFDLGLDCANETPLTTRCKQAMYDRAGAYFNRRDVQKAIHANTTGQVPGPWAICNRTLTAAYNQTDFQRRATSKEYPGLLAKGLRVMLFSGNTDARVPFAGTRAWIDDLNLTPTGEWRPWVGADSVFGWGNAYQEGLTFVVVRDAGHFSAMNHRDRLFDLFSRYIQNQAVFS